MSITFDQADATLARPKITVIGVGGAGGNAVNNMIRSNLEGVEFVVANTDAQALAGSTCEKRIQLGVNITQGLGAGARSDIGRAAAEEVMDDIVENIQGSNMVFVTAGMGGGTGTGAAPVIARAAREQGILTVGVVSKPFQFEGANRMRSAEQGIEELSQFVDTLIVIPNQNLFRLANENTTFAEAFKMADDVLYSGVRGVTDLMVNPGMINLDFADIRTVMCDMGKAMMGTGEAEGERRAIEAAEAAISNPLLDEVSMHGAKAVIINITGGMDMTLFEMDEAAERVREEVDADAVIIWGTAIDQSMEGRMRVSVVATGIEGVPKEQQDPAVSGQHGQQRPNTAMRGFLNGGMSGHPATPSNTTAGSLSGANTAVSRPQPRQAAVAQQPAASRPTSSPAVEDFEDPAAPVARAPQQERPQQEKQPMARTAQDLAHMLSEQKAAEMAARKQQSERSVGASHDGQALPPRRAKRDLEQTRQRGELRGASDLELNRTHEAPAYERRAAARPAPQQDTDYADDAPFIAPPAAQAEDPNAAYAPAPRSAQQAPQNAGRSPSLFERVTGGNRGGDANGQAMPQAGQQQPTNQPGAGDAQQRPAQPAAQSDEDLLDIPAFLRRQAN